MPHISEHSKGQSVIISASHLEKGKLRLGVAGNHLTCSQLSASETASSGYPNSPYRAWRKRCHCPACALSPLTTLGLCSLRIVSYLVMLVIKV